MAHVTGKNAYISFGGVEIQADNRSLSWDESTDVADTTAGADAFESHVVTTKNVEFSLTLLYDNSAAGTATTVAVANGAAGTLDIGPEGTATGKPRYTIVGTVTGKSPTWDYDGESEFDITITANGAWVNHYDTSTGSGTW